MSQRNPDVRAMFDASTLGWWDLWPDRSRPPRDFVVTIEGVKPEVLTAPGGSKSRRPVVKLHKTEKALVLNKTNAKAIAGMYGHDTREWVGKRIAIYADPDVKFGREKVGGIRVRPTVPRGGKSEGVKSQPVDQEARAKQNEAAGRSS